MKRIMKLGVVFVIIVVLLSWMFTVSAEYSAPQEVTASIFSLPNDTIEGKMDVVVKGNTYINLLGDGFKTSTNLGSFSGTYTDNGYAKFIGSGSYKNFFFNMNKVDLKVNTQYTILVDIRKNTLDGTLYVNQSDGKTAFDEQRTINAGSTGEYKFLLTTVSDFSDVNYSLRGFVSKDATDGEIELRIAIYEGDFTEKTVKYLETTKTTKLQNISCYSKNALKDGFLTSNNLSSFSGIYLNNGYAKFVGSGSYKNFFFNIEKAILEENTQYTILVDIRKNTLDGTLYVNQSDGKTAFDEQRTINVGLTGEYKFLLTTVSDFSNVNYSLRGFVSKDATNGEIELRIMIVKGDWISKQLEYEPYKESTAYIPEGTELYSLPNGVQDELDIGKGLLTKRIGQDSNGDYYQLSQPETIQLTPQNLIAYPNGTVIVETEDDSTLPTIEYSVPIDMGSQIDNHEEQINGLLDMVNNNSKAISSLSSKVNAGPFKITCTPNTPFNLVLTAGNTNDFGSRKFTVLYNEDELDVTDLCAATTELDTGTSPMIEGTNIAVSKDDPGIIEFIIYNPVEESKNWSGAVNTIVFTPKTGVNEATVTYVVE